MFEMISSGSRWAAVMVASLALLFSACGTDGGPAASAVADDPGTESSVEPVTTLPAPSTTDTTALAKDSADTSAVVQEEPVLATVAPEPTATIPTITSLDATSARRIATQLTEAFISRDLAVVESLLENGGKWVGLNLQEYDASGAVEYLRPILDGIEEAHPPEEPFTTPRGFAFVLSETLVGGNDITYVLTIEQMDSGALLISDRWTLPDDAEAPDSAVAS